MASFDTNYFILGTYRLTEVLGMGAMGYVYRARQLNLDRDVAIKILSPMLAHEIGYVDMFIREARIAASLEHPHIVPIFDYGVQQDYTYVAMRLLPGGSLGDRIKHRVERRAPLPSLPEINKILMQAASALDYAHEHGVIHRDIKPNNLMFDQHGEVYIVDFGIAKLVGTTSSIQGSTFLGTPSFMAPEQWQGEPATPAVDQYSLGAVVYMMITGHPPFETEMALALMSKHLYETPKDVQAYRPHLPEQINVVLQRAMAKKPEERYPNNDAFAQAFAEAVQGLENEPSTEFTTFALPAVPFPAPLPTPYRPSMGTTQALPNTPIATESSTPAKRQNRVILLGVGGLVIALAIVLIVISLLIAPLLNAAIPTPFEAARLAATETITPETSIEASQLPNGAAALVFQTEAVLPPTLIATDSPSQASSVTVSVTPSNTLTLTAGLTRTETATLISTDAAISSSTLASSSTLTATETPAETATAATATAVPRPTVNWRAGTPLKISNSNGVWLRRSPFTWAAQTATLAQNNDVTATGRNHFDGRQWWWEVTASWGAVGWVEQYSLTQA